MTVLRDTADLSPDGRYRYLLTRRTGGLGGDICFMGINPSTADATHDDPTIRRMRQFAVDLGAHGFYVTNVFSYRTPDVKALVDVADPFGGLAHERTLRRIHSRALLIIPCWGSLAKLPPSLRPHVVLAKQRLVDLYAAKLRCLGLTTDGEPKHPLFLPRATRLEAYTPKLL